MATRDEPTQCPSRRGGAGEDLRLPPESRASRQRRQSAVLYGVGLSGRELANAGNRFAGVGGKFAGSQKYGVRPRDEVYSRWPRRSTRRKEVVGPHGVDRGPRRGGSASGHRLSALGLRQNNDERTRTSSVEEPSPGRRAGSWRRGHGGPCVP